MLKIKILKLIINKLKKSKTFVAGHKGIKGGWWTTSYWNPAGLHPRQDKGEESNLPYGEMFSLPDSMAVLEFFLGGHLEIEIKKK